MNGSAQSSGGSFAPSPNVTIPTPSSITPMSQTVNSESRYVSRQNCRAWELFLHEAWQTESQELSPKERRLELMRKWEHAEQSFRDGFVERIRVENNRGIVDFMPDIPSENFRKKLDNYPCIRPPISEENKKKWAMLELFLKLDEHLSPLHETELPPIIELDNFFLQNYCREYILDEGNFRLMGMSDLGKPLIYYHIIMVVDEQSFEDGTLLHVDFDKFGNPLSKFRHPAIDSYMPWYTHQNDHLRLDQLLELWRQDYTRREHNLIDFTRPAVSILKEEMESRGISGEEATLRDLAIEAVTTVNPSLLET